MLSSIRQVPRINVADLLRAAAARIPDRPAVIEPAGTPHLGGARRRGRRRGGRVARARGRARASGSSSRCRPGPTWPLALFAVARAGLIAVPIGAGVPMSARSPTGWAPSPSISRGPRPPAGDRPGRRRSCRLVVGRPERFESIGGGEDLTLLARARGDRAVMLSHRAMLAAVAGDRRVRRPSGCATMTGRCRCCRCTTWPAGWSRSCRTR